MTAPVAGIDPHQAQFTVGIVDPNGVELTRDTFPNTARGYVNATDLFVTHRVEQVGIEGSASWGRHVAVAVVAAGFDAREVPAQRSAAQRRCRRVAKTDAIDAVATARALLAEPSLGPVQTLEVYDPLVAELEAVLEHRRALVETRTLLLHHVGDQLAKLPTEIRDQLPTTGKLESRLRKLESISVSDPATRAGAYRLLWLIPLIDQDRGARREIRASERRIDALLDEHGTTLRDEPGVGPISAATLLCEIGDPLRFARESKFARWSGTGAVALSSGEGNSEPVRHRLDTGGNRRVNSVLYIISVTQQPSHPDARASWRARPPRARPDAKPAAPTNATWPTAACGATNTPAAANSRRRLDKGASDTPSASSTSWRPTPTTSCSAPKASGCPIPITAWSCPTRSTSSACHAPKVTFNFADHEQAMRNEIHRLAEDILEAAGVEHTIHVEGNDHLLDGCRMGADPSTSVVDRDCRTWDHPNLYICDASVFVTPGGAQPGQTIMAAGRPPGRPPHCCWSRDPIGAAMATDDLPAAHHRRAKRPLTVAAGPYGHPFHPLLVTVPIGAWVASLVFDLASYWAGEPEVFAKAAFWLIGLGIVGALVAALFGLLDLLVIPRGTRAFTTGLIPMGLNLTVVALFAVGFAMRRGQLDDGAPSPC